MLKPFKYISIDFINVNENETLTVYLKDVKDNSYIQVELRVNHDGVSEIFCDGIEVKSFDMWYPCR